MTELNIDEGLIALIQHQMQLRDPNTEALTDIATAISDHIDRLGRTDTFEGVVDSATGVGKTYILAATIDYLSQARGWNNFVVIVPGRTIREKTIENFTPGSSRDLTKLLGVKTALITADNFETPDTARVMEDPEIVKIYVLTVQILLQPSLKMNRRTRKFTEGLGADFYQWLVDVDDLTVLADEHHLYYGDAFSDAVRGMKPKAILGFTATPHPKTPTNQIIYGYPLALAIADKFVKTPVIVGRKDDRSDLATKLNDGITLLECKRAALDVYLIAHPDVKPINPFMLVVASDTSEAEEIADLLRSPDFRGGSYADSVLQVDSKVTEEKEPGMWQRLAAVDSPDSKVKVVVSVAMLKEGWDVKGVYVLLSTQPSLSTILTEQVLGRGLRLPFGAYTGVEMLDTLEVVAHDRFAALLERAGVLNDTFVSYRTRTRVMLDQNGDAVVRQVQEPVGRSLVTVDHNAVRDVNEVESELSEWDGSDLDAPGVVAISEVAARTSAAAIETTDLNRVPIGLKAGAPQVVLPKLSQRPVARRFSLADITTDQEFESLGKSLRANPDDELRRMKLTADRVVGVDGVIRSQTRKVTAEDAITSRATLDLPIDASRDELISHILGLPMVDSSFASRSIEKSNAGRLVDRVIEGLGPDAAQLLSAYSGRTAVRLAQLIRSEQRKLTPSTGYSEEVKFSEFVPQRNRGLRTDTTDVHGTFDKRHAYIGWKKSLVPIEWFDSEPERAVALILDGARNVEWWIRLQQGDLSIIWGSGQRYNPDFLVAEPGGDRTLLEVKADDRVDDQSVVAKRESARQWVNYANGHLDVQSRGEVWRYLLVSESDIRQSKGSWNALKNFG